MVRQSRVKRHLNLMLVEAERMWAVILVLVSYRSSGFILFTMCISLTIIQLTSWGQTIGRLHDVLPTIQLTLIEGCMKWSSFEYLPILRPGYQQQTNISVDGTEHK